MERVTVFRARLSVTPGCSVLLELCLAVDSSTSTATSRAGNTRKLKASLMPFHLVSLSSLSSLSGKEVNWVAEWPEAGRRANAHTGCSASELLSIAGQLSQDSLLFRAESCRWGRSWGHMLLPSKEPVCLSQSAHYDKRVGLYSWLMQCWAL